MGVAQWHVRVVVACNPWVRALPAATCGMRLNSPLICMMVLPYGSTERPPLVTHLRRAADNAHLGCRMAALTIQVSGCCEGGDGSLASSVNTGLV